MKTVLPAFLSLVALAILSSIQKYAGITTAQIDIHVLLIVFLGLTGAEDSRNGIAAFLVGWAADLMTGFPNGLFLMSGMMTYLAARLASLSVDNLRGPAFVFLAFVFEIFHCLMLRFLCYAKDIPNVLTMGGVIKSALFLVPFAVLALPAVYRCTETEQERRRRRRRGSGLL